MKRASFLVALVVLATSCTDGGPDGFADLAADSFARPQYIDEMFRRVDLTDPTDLRFPEGDVQMQTLPAVGREDRHAEVEDWPIVAGQCAALDDYDGNVLTTIASRAADTRIVIVNEAHDRPHHREFIRRLAAAIAPLGYTHFAAEAFDPDTFENDRLPYARTDFGTYVSEPVFGSLVRTAKDLELTMIAYDAKSVDEDTNLDIAEQIDRREERQALRLAEVVADLPESGRILTHVGYSHASEVPVMGVDGSPFEWMAARLKRLSGIDPLTIDQTACRSGSDESRLMAQGERHVDGQFDLVVGHPDMRFIDGRPAWRAEGQVKMVAIPDGLINESGRTIVEARYLDEPIDAVPIDRVMLWPGESLPLLLPDRSYRIVAFHEGSDEQASTTIDVD